ncbi:MAG: GxxExxY protein [Blastocatellia bacterium]
MGKTDGDKITEAIIGCAYTVHNELRPGFLEKVYENALRKEITKKGLKVIQQADIKVWYDGEVVGVYSADLWVEDRIIVELKAAQSLVKDNEMQLVHYLTATKVETGLLINFGSSSVQIKRKYRVYKPPSKPQSDPVNPDENPVNPVLEVSEEK